MCAACADKKQDTSAAPAATVLPPLVLPPGPTNQPNVPIVQQFNFPTGAVVDLNISDVTVLENYYGGALNLPAGPVLGVKLNMDFKGIAGTGTYKGNIKIAYLEGANYHEGSFISGPQDADNVFNKFDNNGQLYFKAFVQDVKGALIIVMDNISPAGVASGRVYFRNFNILPYQNPVQGNLVCWRLSAGPYDCRDYLSGNSIYPSRTDSLGSYYTELGRFSNMSLNAALNM